MDHAIDMAKKKGVGMVTAVNSSHCGALSYFVQKAADEKLIGMAMTHTDSITIEHPGHSNRLFKNRMCFGVDPSRP